MNKPFFSIITATFNAEKSLPRLLKSLEAQVCRDFEIIIQDGGSHDLTLALCSEFKETFPNIIINSEFDSGIYDAWNKAVKHAKGQWVLFLGADDQLCAPDTLQQCMEYLRPVNDGIVYAVGGVSLCDASGKVVTNMPGKNIGVEAHLPKGYAPFWQNGLFHHRSLFENVRFDPRFKIFGDYDFICRSWKDASAIHIPITVAKITLGGISNSMDQQLQARWEALRIAYNHFGYKSLPYLIISLSKGGIVYISWKILGNKKSSMLLNYIRKKRGLAPTWIVDENSEPKQKKRELNKGYLYNNRTALYGCNLIDRFLSIFPIKKKTLPEKVDSILLLKPDHLGDVFLMGGILPLLKEKFPNAQIDLVAGRWAEPVAKNLPYIQDIFWLDHWMLNRNHIPAWKKLFVFLQDYIKTLHTVRKRHYDLCLSLRAFGGNLISLGFISKAKFLVGHGTAGFGHLLDAQASWQSGVHETDHFLEVLSLCGIKLSQKKTLNYPMLADHNFGRYRSVKERLKIPSVFSVIAPCSGDKKRMFQNSYWRNIIAASPNMQFVISVSGHERHVAESIATDFSNVIIQDGQFCIPDLVLLFAEAVHIHTVDSFSAHIAGASGTPTTVHCLPSGADMHQFSPLGQNVVCLFKNDPMGS